MAKTSWQAQREAQRKKQRRNKLLLYGGLGLAALAAVALVLFIVLKPPDSPTLMGDAVEVPSRDHVADSAVPGPYMTNPPAGGAHYSTDWTEKFYQESDLPGLPPHPEGYLVHSLEHGYVIFWYNCQVANTDCAALKQTIQSVMDATGGTKEIAFPWATQDTALVMTSWGRILRFPRPDAEQMKKFVLANRYQAPEPDAP